MDYVTEIVRNIYLLSKIVGEYLMDFSQLNFVIFRPHNIYGPNMGFKHVLPQIINKVKVCMDSTIAFPTNKE